MNYPIDLMRFSSKLRGRGKLTEDNISEAVRDVKRALFEADVNYRVVKKFAAAVEEKALGSQVLAEYYSWSAVC